MTHERADPGREALLVVGGGLRLALEFVGEFHEEMVDGRPPQCELRLEVVVDLRLMHSGTLRDRTRRCTFETVRSELDDRRLDERGTGGVGEVLAGHVDSLYHLI